MTDQYYRENQRWVSPYNFSVADKIEIAENLDEIGWIGLKPEWVVSAELRIYAFARAGTRKTSGKASITYHLEQMGIRDAGDGRLAEMLRHVKEKGIEKRGLVSSERNSGKLSTAYLSPKDRRPSFKPVELSAVAHVARRENRSNAILQFHRMQKLLAANRGEIAIRIMRAATELGLGTVGIYSKEDRLSLHRFKADETYLIGEEKGPVEAYLDVEGIVALAAEKGVDAIHPGYGFLSENPALPRACEKAGITFVGPSAELLELLGDKTAARRLGPKGRRSRCSGNRAGRVTAGPSSQSSFEDRLPSHHQSGLWRRRTGHASSGVPG